MSKKLQPVGTRFSQFYPPPEGSTEMYGKHCTWEVVAHVRCARFIGDKRGVLREESRAVDITQETEDEFQERMRKTYRDR